MEAIKAFISSETFLAVLWTVGKALIIIFLGHLIGKGFVRLAVRILKRTKTDELIVALVRRILIILSFAIVIVAALSELGVSTAGLLAALGAIAAAIVLALQSTLANLVGGVMLVVKPRFSAGDIINVEGDEGYVVRVDLLHTTIRTYDTREITIPNGLIVNSKVSNLSATLRRVTFDFPLPYGSDVAFAKETVLKILRTCPTGYQDNEHQPSVKVSKYEDSSVTLETRLWCKPADYWETYYFMTEALLIEMDKNGIHVPFNRLDVTVVNR